MNLLGQQRRLRRRTAGSDADERRPPSPRRSAAGPAQAAVRTRHPVHAGRSALRLAAVLQSRPATADAPPPAGARSDAGRRLPVGRLPPWCLPSGRLPAGRHLALRPLRVRRHIGRARLGGHVPRARGGVRKEGAADAGRRLGGSAGGVVGGCATRRRPRSRRCFRMHVRAASTSHGPASFGSQRQHHPQRHVIGDGGQPRSSRASVNATVRMRATMRVDAEVLGHAGAHAARRARRASGSSRLSRRPRLPFLRRPRRTGGARSLGGRTLAALAGSYGGIAARVLLGLHSFGAACPLRNRSAVPPGWSKCACAASASILNRVPAALVSSSPRPRARSPACPSATRPSSRSRPTPRPASPASPRRLHRQAPVAHEPRFFARQQASGTCSPTSDSSMISPTISSTMSSTVIKPSVPPYSSTTMAICCRFVCISDNRREQVLRLGHEHEPRRRTPPTGSFSRGRP